MNQFRSNLKSTLKFISLVYFPVAIFIVIDSIREDDYENALVPLYMVLMLPSIFISVWVYSKLETVKLNKIIRMFIFSITGTFSLISFYFFGDFLDSNAIDIKFMIRMSILSLIIQSLLYLQLPWSSESDV